MLVGDGDLAATSLGEASSSRKAIGQISKKPGRVINNYTGALPKISKAPATFML